MKHAVTALVLLMVAGASPATASAGPPADRAAMAMIRPSLEACLRAHPAMRPQQECFAAEETYQQAMERRAYRKLWARLPADRRRALAASEKAWPARLDARCQTRDRLGSLASVEAQQCNLLGYAERRVWLAEHLAATVR